MPLKAREAMRGAPLGWERVLRRRVVQRRVVERRVRDSRSDKEEELEERVGELGFMVWERGRGAFLGCVRCGNVRECCDGDMWFLFIFICESALRG